MKHTLPDLPYDYDALEPYIDERTMKIHHTKHHAGYVNNLNNVIKGVASLEELTAEDLLKKHSDIPEEIRQSVINNAGGHVNHSLYWKTIQTPENGSNPDDEFKAEIDNTFESLDGFLDQFKSKAMSVFGSGWAFLVVNNEKKLEITRQSFQNNPLLYGQIPILGIDVWEHAYYLKYQNNRSDYVDNFVKIINWKEVGNLFNSAIL